MRTLRLLLACALLALVGAPSTVATVQAELDPQLQAELATATGQLEVVVTFAGSGQPSAADVQALRDVGITTGFTYRTLPSAGVLATPAQVAELSARPEVVSLWSNRALSYENAEATALTGVDRVRSDAKLTRKNGGRPIDGFGVGILINDSGVDGLHADLDFGPHLVQNVEAATNLRAWSDLLPVTYVENVENTDATGGHGTHVAGIAGGTGAMSAGKYEGVAPGSPLVGYGSGAGLAILDVLGGFDYAIANRDRYGIRVINNSWGDTSDSCTPVNPLDPVTRATKNAYNAGILVVFSAGKARASARSPATTRRRRGSSRSPRGTSSGTSPPSPPAERPEAAAPSRSTARPGSGRIGRP